MSLPPSFLQSAACRHTLLALPPALLAVALGLEACGPVYRTDRDLQLISRPAVIAKPVVAERQRPWAGADASSWRRRTKSPASPGMALLAGPPAIAEAQLSRA